MPENPEEQSPDQPEKGLPLLPDETGVEGDTPVSYIPVTTAGQNLARELGTTTSLKEQVVRDVDGRVSIALKERENLAKAGATAALDASFTDETKPHLAETTEILADTVPLGEAKRQPEPPTTLPEFDEDE